MEKQFHLKTETHLSFLPAGLPSGLWTQICNIHFLQAYQPHSCISQLLKVSLRYISVYIYMSYRFCFSGEL